MTRAASSSPAVEVAQAQGLFRLAVVVLEAPAELRQPYERVSGVSSGRLESQNCIDSGPVAGHSPSSQRAASSGPAADLGSGGTGSAVPRTANTCA